MTGAAGSGDVVAGSTIAWRVLYREAVDRLGAAGLISPEVDARRIVERASGNEGAAFALGLEDLVTVRGVATFDALLARREAGEPLQYVLGGWGFRQLDLLVDQRVLIPRPETEQVVEAALGELRRIGGTGSDARPVTVVDLGTGSGAIALSVAVEHVHASVWATDASPDALAVTRANIAGIGRPGGRVRVAEGDWFGALPEDLQGEVELVVSNPPYVAAGDGLPAEVADWEPTTALIAGPSGMEHLERIVADAPSWLRPGGVLVVELAPWQAARIADLARQAGFASTEVGQDLAGRDRYAVARLAT
ncbi:MAG: peptide chain release factor N(5)-glutamine methyltransferase [Acidimicrobiales bacterium]